MDNLHPVMQEALSGFIPGFQRPPVQQPDPYALPRLAADEREYEWHTDCSEPIVCYLSYEKAQAEDEINPPYPANVSLFAAYLRGVDIFNLLSRSQIDEIEELAAQSFEG